MKKVSLESKTARVFFCVGIVLLLFVLFCVSLSGGAKTSPAVYADVSEGSGEAEVTTVTATKNGVTLTLENPKLKSSTGFENYGYVLTKDLAQNIDFSDIAESFATVASYSYQVSVQQGSRYYETCQMTIPMMLSVEAESYEATDENIDVSNIYLTSDNGKSILKRYTGSSLTSCDYLFYSSYSTSATGTLDTTQGSVIKDQDGTDYWNYGFKCSNSNCVYYTDYAKFSDVINNFHNYLKSDTSSQLDPYLNGSKKSSLDGSESAFVSGGQLKNSDQSVVVTPSEYYSKTCVKCPNCGSAMDCAGSTYDALSHIEPSAINVSGASGFEMAQQDDGANVFFKLSVSSIQISGKNWMGDTVSDLTIYDANGNASVPLAGVYYISNISYSCDIKIPYYSYYTYTVLAYEDGYQGNALRRYMVDTSATYGVAEFTASDFGDSTGENAFYAKSGLNFTYSDYSFPLILTSSITIADREEFADNLIGEVQYNSEKWSDHILLHDSDSNVSSYSDGSYAYSNKNTSYAMFSFERGIISGQTVDTINLSSLSDYLEIVWYEDDSAAKYITDLEETASAGDYYLAIMPKSSLRDEYKFEYNSQTYSYSFSLVYVKQNEEKYVPDKETSNVPKASSVYNQTKNQTDLAEDEKLMFYLQPFSVQKVKLNFDIAQGIGLSNNTEYMEEEGDTSCYVKEKKKIFNYISYSLSEIGYVDGQSFSSITLYTLKTGRVYNEKTINYTDSNLIQNDYQKATHYDATKSYYYCSETVQQTGDDTSITLYSMQECADLTSFGYQDGTKFGNVEYYTIYENDYALTNTYQSSVSSYYYRDYASEYSASLFFNAINIESKEDWVSIGGLEEDYDYYNENYAGTNTALLDFTGTEFPGNKTGIYDYIYVTLAINKEDASSSASESETYKLFKNYQPIFLVDGVETELVSSRSSDVKYCYKYEKEDAFKLVPRSITITYEDIDGEGEDAVDVGLENSIYGDYFSDSQILNQYFKLDEETAKVHNDSVYGVYYTLKDSDEVDLGTDYGVNDLEWIIKIVASGSELTKYSNKNVVYIIPRFYQNVETEEGYTHKDTDYIRKPLSENDPIDVDIATDYFRQVTEYPLLPYVKDYCTGIYYIAFSVEVVPGNDSDNGKYNSYTTSWGNGLLCVQPVGEDDVEYSESNTNRLVSSSVALKMDTPFKVSVSGLSIYFRSDDIGYTTVGTGDEAVDSVTKVYDGTTKTYTSSGEESTVVGYLMSVPSEGIIINGKKYASILAYDLENNFSITAQINYDKRFSGENISFVVRPSDGNTTLLTSVANATKRQQAIRQSYVYEAEIDETTKEEICHSVYYKNVMEETEGNIVNTASILGEIGVITPRNVKVNLLYDDDKIIDTENIMYTTGDYSRSYLGKSGVALRVARNSETTTDNNTTLLDIYLNSYNSELHDDMTKDDIRDNYSRYGDYYYVYYLDESMSKIEVGYMFYGDLLLYAQTNKIMFVYMEISTEDGEGFINDEGFTWAEKKTVTPCKNEGTVAFQEQDLFSDYTFTDYFDIQFINDNGYTRSIIETSTTAHDLLDWNQAHIMSPTAESVVKFNVDTTSDIIYYLFLDSEFTFVNYKLDCKGSYVSSTQFDATKKYISIEVKKAFVPQDAFKVNEQLVSNEEYLVYNGNPHNERLVWETDSDIQLAKSYVHIDYEGHDEVRLPGEAANDTVRFYDEELDQIITDYQRYIKVIEYRYLLADGTYSDAKSAAADTKIANMTYAGMYTLELTLPETTNYYASDPFEFYVVVSPAKVYVYSTVASRKYMDEYDKEKEITFSEDDYIIVSRKTELDYYLGGIDLNSGDIVDVWTDDLTDKGYTQIYLYKDNDGADSEHHTMIYAYDTTVFSGFTGDDAQKSVVKDISLQLTGGDYESYVDNSCIAMDFIQYSEAYCRNFTFVYPGENYFCKTLYIWAQELAMDMDYYQEATYSGRSVTPKANIFNESGVEMELSDSFAISQYIAGYCYVKEGKLILLDNTGTPLIFATEKDDTKSNAYYFFKNQDNLDIPIYYKDSKYYYINENEEEEDVTVTLNGVNSDQCSFGINKTTGAFGTVTVQGNAQPIYLHIDVRNKTKINIEDVYSFTDYTWTFKGNPILSDTPDVYLYYKMEGVEQEYKIARDNNGFYLVDEPTTYITVRFLGTLRSDNQVASAVIHSEEKAIYLGANGEYDIENARDDIAIVQNSAYDGCYLVYVNVQIEATGSANYKPGSDSLIMLKINRLEIAFDNSEENESYYAQKHYNGLTYTISTFEYYFKSKESNESLSSNEFSNAYSWAQVHIDGFKYYDCFNQEIQLNDTLIGELSAGSYAYQKSSKIINAGIYEITIIAELNNDNIFINDSNVTMVGNVLTFQTYLAVKRYGEDNDTNTYNFTYTYVGEYTEKTKEYLYKDYDGTFGTIGYTLGIDGVGGGYTSNNGEIVGVSCQVTKDISQNTWINFFSTQRTFESDYTAQEENDTTKYYYLLQQYDYNDYLNSYLVGELQKDMVYDLYTSSTVYNNDDNIQKFNFKDVCTDNNGIAFSLRFTINPKTGCNAKKGDETFFIYDNNYATETVVVHVVINKRILYVTPKCIDEDGSNKVYGETNKSAESKFTMEFEGFAEGDEDSCMETIEGHYPVINWKNLSKDQYQSVGTYKIYGKIGTNTIELSNYEYDFSNDISFEVLPCTPRVEMQQKIEYQGKAVIPSCIRYGFDGKNLDTDEDDKLGTAQRKIECIGILQKNQVYSYVMKGEDTVLTTIGENGVCLADIADSNFLRLKDEQGNYLSVSEIDLLDNTIFEPLGSSKDVGYYLYKVTLGASQNYTAVEPTYYIVQITKKNLDVYLINPATNTRGQGTATKVYDKKTDTYPEFTIEYDGFVGSDIKTLGGSNYYSTVPFLYQTDLENFVGTDDVIGTGNVNGILINPLYYFVDKYGEVLSGSTSYPINVTDEGYYVKLLVDDENIGCGLSDNYSLNVHYYVDNKTTLYPNMLITARPVQVQYNPETCSKITKVYDGKNTVNEDSISSDNYEFIAVEGIEESGLVGDDEAYLSFVYSRCSYKRSDVYREEDGEFVKDDIEVYTYVNSDLYTANNYVNKNYKLYWDADNTDKCIILYGTIEQANATVVFYSDEGHTSPARSQIVVTYTGDLQKVYPIVHGVETDKTVSGFEEFTEGTDYSYRYYSDEIRYDSSDPGATPSPKNCATYIFELTIKNESLNSLNYKASIYAIYLIIDKTNVDIEFYGDSNQYYGEISTGLSAKAKGVGNYTKDISVQYFAKYAKVPVQDKDGKVIGYVDSIDGFSEPVESISQADAGIYYAVAIYESTTNFKDGYSYEEFTVSRKKIMGAFSYAQTYQYSGSTPNISYYVLFENQKLVPDLLYNKKVNGVMTPYNYSIEDGEIVNVTNKYPVDVGEYQVKPNITSIKNFIVTGCDWVDFSITKADLVVSISQKTIKEGETYTPSYSIKGKLTDIDDTKLFKKIQFKYYNAETGEELSEEPTKPGMYKIEPYNVETENYNVTCVAGNFIINKNEISTIIDNKGQETENNIVIDGSFASDMSIKVSEKQNKEHSELKKSFDSFKENNSSFAGYSLSTVFEFEIENYTYSSDNAQDYVIKLYLPEIMKKVKNAASNAATTNILADEEGGIVAEEGKYYVAVLYQNGTIDIVEADVSDDYLSIETNNLQIKALSFLTTETEEETENLDWVLYVCIALAAVIIALTIVVVIKRKDQ